MNEIKEILAAIADDGISDDRLSEIRAGWRVLGQLLDAAESQGGVDRQSVASAQAYLSEFNMRPEPIEDVSELPRRRGDLEIARQEAEESCRWLATELAGQSHQNALSVRSILLGLYRGGGHPPFKVDISDVMALDFTVRRELCKVLLGANIGSFDVARFRDIFEAARPGGCEWFLAGLEDEKA